MLKDQKIDTLFQIIQFWQLNYSLISLAADVLSNKIISKNFKIEIIIYLLMLE